MVEQNTDALNVPISDLPNGPRANAEIIVSETRERKKILLVSPESERTYWSYEYSLPLIGKKGAHAPLGLMTLAGMLPKEWDLELVDMSVRPLEQAAIENSDAVMLSGMHVQAKSMHEVAARVQAAGKLAIGGGPYVSSSPEECENLDHLVLGEAEGGIDEWIRLFEQGRAPKVAEMKPFPTLAELPPPRFDLINVHDYATMNIQLSRGCPQNCEFCSVTKLNGRNPRVKSSKQFVSELEALNKTGYRGSLFFVDDNFIGNRKRVEEILPDITTWQKEHDYPFNIMTQSDVRLAEFDSLMIKMREAGFGCVFLGIETTSKAAHEESRKTQNAKVDLDEAVDKITRAGLECMSGFIVGFDSDDEGTIEELVDFIQRNPIPHAMLGVLQALPQTDLLKRMQAEGRMKSDFGGEQFGIANFETSLNVTVLRQKYAKALASIYEPNAYFKRCLNSLKIGKNSHYSAIKQQPLFAFMGVINSFIKQGLLSHYRIAYWKFLATVLTTMPSRIGTAFVHAVKLEHLNRFTNEDVLPRLMSQDA